MTKRFLLIGQRDSVLDVLAAHSAVDLIGCIALRGSHLERAAHVRGLPTVTVEPGEKTAALAAIESTAFDVLLSVGCPWKLPIARLRERMPDALFLNVHPSCLPRLRGAHPLNGAILNDEPRIGASVHVMEEEFDTGAVIAQRCIERTEELDLALLYAISRLLEAEAMQLALETLVASDFAYRGIPQHGEPSSYTRRPEDMTCDATTTPSTELIRRVRAFGVSTQGCTVHLADRTIVAFDAQRITHPYLHERFKNAAPGTVLLKCDRNCLLRTLDGAIVYLKC
ncbi:MAG: hypothetical protein KatS3mg038_3682 [Candidatus Kapaibacterium sp.]|nr:MAG: hypothetical protein KatS3mg038_3682 [Candidatus Kapabacteria bacterium]